MSRYRGVSNVAREVVKRYRGVSNVARQITKSYRGVSNVARQFFGDGYKYTWPLKRSSNEYYTVNEYFAGVDGDTWKFVLDVTGIQSGKDLVNRLRIDGDLGGKTISFDYTNTYYDVGKFTCEFICYNNNGTVLYKTQLTRQSTFLSFYYTMPSNTAYIAFGYWCNPYTDHLSSTLTIKNVLIDGERLI